MYACVCIYLYVSVSDAIYLLVLNNVRYYLLPTLPAPYYLVLPKIIIFNYSQAVTCGFSGWVFTSSYRLPHSFHFPIFIVRLSTISQLTTFCSYSLSFSLSLSHSKSRNVRSLLYFFFFLFFFFFPPPLVSRTPSNFFPRVLLLYLHPS